MNKTVTIIVTVYNIKEYLDRFFHCLEAQTFGDYEALIVDDGSTDGSVDICRRYAEQDDRIRVCSIEHAGISAARNHALKHIRTEYVTSLDGDDYFDKDYLKHLIEAEEEYGADMIIAGIINVYENGEELDRFKERPRAYYTREDFLYVLPELLDENRLNYLYAKLYKAEILRDIRLEDDVRQGSDTMINCMYLEKVQSIAVTEDYDYSYVHYTKRSVTSYLGPDYFSRLLRINRFVSEHMEKAGFMNDEMRRVIDGRFLWSGSRYLSRSCKTDMPVGKLRRIASDVLSNDEYMTAYRRQKELGNIAGYRFRVLEPGKEQEFIDHVRGVKIENDKNEKLKKLRELCPDPIFEIWHRAKTALGIARK